MNKFEPFTETDARAQELLDMSAQLATGEYFMSEEQNQPIRVQYRGKPQTTWAQTVDAIEADFAPSYDDEEYQNPALQALNLEELDMLAQVLDASEAEVSANNQARTLLDIGCGTGRIAVFSAARGFTISAFDQTAGYAWQTAAKLVEVVTRTKPEVFVAPVEDVVEEPQQYDNITAMFAVLNHCEDWASILRKLPGKLTRDGSLCISMYGSPEAAVFKAVKGGLGYAPGILVKRVAGGIVLGETTDQVLPAAFPYPNEVMAELTKGGAGITQLTPFLSVTSLYPRQATGENIALYLQVVKNIYGKEISNYLEQFKNSPKRLLVASLCADYKVDADRVNDAAYYGVVARKDN